MDAVRNSGSNGLTTCGNYNIIKLLNTNTAFIRKVKGAKVSNTPTKWNYYYLAAGGQGKSDHMQDRKVARWPYSQPQLGGQFDITNEYFDKFHIIVKNTKEVKYSSALLAVVLGGEYNIVIQYKAVSATINGILKCHKLMKGVSIESSILLIHFCHYRIDTVSWNIQLGIILMCSRVGSNLLKTR